jgi:hypothetical protein
MLNIFEHRRGKRRVNVLVHVREWHCITRQVEEFWVSDNADTVAIHLNERKSARLLVVYWPANRSDNRVRL